MTVNLAAIKEKLAKAKQGLKRAGATIKPKPGKNRYVILPPYNSDGAFYHDYGQHFIKDEADQLQAIYVCADRTHGEPCPICDTMAEAQRTVGVHDKAVSELIKKQYAAQQYLVNVLALDSDQPDTPQVLQIGKKAFEQLLTLVESWTEQVFDPVNPQIVIIERTGTTQNDTAYTVQPAPTRHALKKAVKPIDLDEFVKQESENAEKKAIAALRALAGLGGPPRLGSNKTAAAVADEFEDVPDSVTQPGAKTAAPAKTSVQLDEELDSLLDGIDA